MTQVYTEERTQRFLKSLQPKKLLASVFRPIPGHLISIGKGIKTLAQPSPIALGSRRKMMSFHKAVDTGGSCQHLFDVTGSGVFVAVMVLQLFSGILEFF